MTLVQMNTSNSGHGGFMALANLDQAAIEAFPEAVYLCAGDGTVIRSNQRAVEAWGRAPKPGDPKERFCGSFRLYRPDGTVLPHDQCPMATALRTGESFHNQEVMVEQPSGERRTVLVNIAPFRHKDGRVSGAINCFRDITDRKQAEERQRDMIQELNHRIKNTFATVHSMAASTARDALSVDDFRSRFEARLLALSKAHALSGEDEQGGARLHDLLAQQLEPVVGGETSRVRLEGPEIALQPRAALALSMVFHELMTNAAKYGPLSTAQGQVLVNWNLLLDSEGDHTLTLSWSEVGGPPVERPRRTGFGTRLIKRTVTDGLGGQIELLFQPSGLQLLMSIPFRE